MCPHLRDCRLVQFGPTVCCYWLNHLSLTKCAKEFGYRSASQSSSRLFPPLTNVALMPSGESEVLDMRVVIAVHGTRGDIEPCAAVGSELLRRGHSVQFAVPPNLVRFIESVGFPSVIPWGPDSTGRVLSWDPHAVAKWDAQRDGNYDRADRKGTSVSARSLSSLKPLTTLKLFRAYLVDGWAQMGRSLADLASDADVILTGMTYQEVAFNVAEFYEIPLVAMHWCPLRSNDYSLPFPLPRPIRDGVFALTEWVYWRALKPAEEEQRVSLGLAKPTTRSARRIVERGTVEIQAYDRALFPGLDGEWPERPFVGFLGLSAGTPNDADVAAWIDAGAPPVYFGFGSTPIDDPVQVLDMIRSVCMDLGIRGLVNCSGWNLPDMPCDDVVKVVDRANYRLVFPKCRAVVHHGGAGTVAEGVRSGVPTVAVWSTADQPLWARRIEKLGIGSSLKLARMTRESLSGSLRKVLAPGFGHRVREIAANMTTPAEGVEMAANAVENAVMSRASSGAQRR